MTSPTKREEARRWARPEEVLTADELTPPRVYDFIELMVDCAERLAENSDDITPLEWIHARSVASDFWKLDRESSDAKVVDTYVKAARYQEGRRAAVREVDQRTSIKAVLLRSVSQSVGSLDLLRRGASGEMLDEDHSNVVSIRPKKAKG